MFHGKLRADHIVENIVIPHIVTNVYPAAIIREKHKHMNLTYTVQRQPLKCNISTSVALKTSASIGLY
jgi:hypothetical protein